jgi:hypothetical protein
VQRAGSGADEAEAGRAVTLARRISWRRVAGWCVLLMVLFAVGVELRRRSEPALPLPMSTSPRQDAADEAQVRALAAAHDVAVLRAALDGRCGGADAATLLSDVPLDSFDWRTVAAQRVPVLPDCPGLRLAAGEDIAQAVSAPETSHDPRQVSGWSSLEKRFPHTVSLVQVSLPHYSDDGLGATVTLESAGGCTLCRSGWEITLRRDGSRWVRTGQRATFIS